MASRQPHGPAGAPGRREAARGKVSEFFHVPQSTASVGLRLRGHLHWGLITQVLKWKVLGPWDHQGFREARGEYLEPDLRRLVQGEPGWEPSAHPLPASTKTTPGPTLCPALHVLLNYT